MKNLFKDTYPYFKKYIWIHIFCCVLSAIRMVVLVAEPQILALIVDRVINPAFGEEPATNSSVFSFLIDDLPADDYHAILTRLVGMMFLLMAVYFVTFYTKWHLSHYFGIKSEKMLRKDTLDKINHSSSELLQDYTAGDLLTITNSDPQKLKSLYSDYLTRMVDPVFYITLSAIYLMKISVWLMVFPAITGILYVIVTRRFMRQSKYYYDRQWRKTSELTSEIQESIYGIRTIKAYAREDYQTEIFNKKNEALRDTLFEFGDYRARFGLLYSSIQNSLYIISMIYGIVLSVNFHMTAGEFTSFLSYLMTIAGQFIGISNTLGEMQNCVVSSNRIFSFLRKKDPAKEIYGTKEVSRTPHITLHNVTIRSNDHDENEHADLVTGIDLDLPYGKKVGIMGRTGSGKSVLLKGLQTYLEYESDKYSTDDMYQAGHLRSDFRNLDKFRTDCTDESDTMRNTSKNHGTYTIDGIDVHEYSRESIRRSFGFAMQDIFLFSNTIEANIAYYNPDASSEQVFTCGQVACVDEFANKLPEKYDTIVGEKGFGLSGGQKQRVSIARALLKDAPILVLDDCTNALDFDTEKKIFQNIKDFCGDKTLLIASHRANALKDMDEILFFENGKIVERGTHEELMQLNGRYAEIYHHQAGQEVLE